MSDFEWFGEAFNFSMFNMLDLDLSLFAYFWSYYLSDFDVWYSFRSLGPALQEYGVILPLGGL